MRAIGRYQIVSELGRGGMGTVYRARDPQLGRTVAIKTILFSGSCSADMLDALRRRFIIEARAAASLSHPNIVTIHDFAEENGLAYLVMEFIEGWTLKERMDCGNVPSTELLRILGETAAAIDHAHDHGVVHRDVKPGNLILRRDGVTKLTDFGIAKMSEATGFTQTGIMLGTLQYMPPEVLREEPFGGHGDQYSLGVIAFELLTGRNPFGASSTPAMMRKILFDPPSLGDLEPTTLSALRPLFDRVLAKQPGDRYPSCLAFVKALDDALATGPQRGAAAELDPHIVQDKIMAEDWDRGSAPDSPEVEAVPASSGINPGLDLKVSALSSAGRLETDDGAIETKEPTSAWQTEISHPKLVSGWRKALLLGVAGFILSFCLLYWFATRYNSATARTQSTENAQKEQMEAKGMAGKSNSPVVVGRPIQNPQDLNGPAALTSEEKAWAALGSRADITAFRGFLENYPHSKHADEARARLAKFESSDRAWISVEHSRDPQLLEAFLKNFADDPHAQRVRKVLQDLYADEERSSWDAARKEDSQSAIDAFLARYPTGMFAGEARNRRNALEAERASWESIRTSGNSKAVEAFLKQYTNGRYSEQARSKLADLEETEAWEAMGPIPSEPALNQFLVRFRDGKHANLARARRREVQAEQSEWNEVQNSLDRKRVEVFLVRYPSSAHAAEARARLDRLQITSSPEISTANERQPNGCEAGATIPIGTAISVQLSNRLSSDQEMRTFSSILADPVKINGQIILRTGTVVKGEFARPPSPNIKRTSVGAAIKPVLALTLTEVLRDSGKPVIVSTETLLRTNSENDLIMRTLGVQRVPSVNSKPVTLPAKSKLTFRLSQAACVSRAGQN
jgi:serine/threonine protein kinase